MKTTRKHLTWGLMAACAVLIASSAMGHPLVDPLTLAGLGLMPFAMSGEMDIKGLHELITKQGEAWGEFTRKNDELIKAKAEGKAVADLQATVDKLNSTMSGISADMVELAKKAARPGNEGPGQLTEAQLAYKQAFGGWIRKGNDTGLADLQRKAYNSGSGPDGGYIVLPEMDSEIDRVVSVVSAIGRLATVKNIGTEVYKKVAKKSGMVARRVGAGATGGETATPTFAELEFPVYEAEAEPWVFNSTLDDAIIDLEADLTDEASIAFAELAGNEFAVGTGAGGARGITQYDMVANASYTWGKLGYVITNNSGAFRASNPGDDIIALQHSLKSQYRPGATFVMPDSVLALVRQMKDGSSGFYLWQPDPLTGFGGRLLGSPVETDDNMPVAGADSLSLAYGNFKAAYVVVNRSGTMLIRDNITAKGKTKFNFRRRFGGGVKNFEALKFLKFGTS